MDRFIQRKKMSKKARKLLDKQRRVTWSFSPTSRKVESKKRYSRKKRMDDDAPDFDGIEEGLFLT